MKIFMEQSISESERSIPVVPDTHPGERSVPSESATSGRRGGRIIYSSQPHKTAYSLRLRRTGREH